MIKREGIYEAFDNGLIGLDDIIDICYNKAIDDFTDYIRPIISEYICALKNNRYAFIDIGEINRKLKVGGENEK